MDRMTTHPTATERATWRPERDEWHRCQAAHDAYRCPRCDTPVDAPPSAQAHGAPVVRVCEVAYHYRTSQKPHPPCSRLGDRGQQYPADYMRLLLEG